MNDKVKLEVKDIFVIFFTKSFLPEVADVIGADNTVKLISAFGGTELNLPSKKEFLKVCRNICIYVGYNNGMSPTKLSKQYGLTQQRVGQLYRETKAQIEAYNTLKEQGLTEIRLADIDTNANLTRVHEALSSGNIIDTGDIGDE